MNTDNVVELHGTVHADPISGSAWTRWKPGGRGQVRFWLAVSRTLAGEGYDVLLCCVEPKEAKEVDRLAIELRAGRSVHLVCQARRIPQGRHPNCEEDTMTIVFVAETCGLDGTPPIDAHKVGFHPPRRKCAHGKMAAAGDVEQEQPDLLVAAGGDR